MLSMPAMGGFAIFGAGDHAFLLFSILRTPVAIDAQADPLFAIDRVKIFVLDQHRGLDPLRDDFAAQGFGLAGAVLLHHVPRCAFFG